MLRQSFAVTLIVMFACESAFASADPLTGVRISLLGAETVLASPPLPDLTENDKAHLTTQGSYMTANVDDNTDFGGGFTQGSNGTFRGGSVGIGYTTPSRSAWGFYGFTTFNKLVGNLQISQTGNPTISLTNMSNEAFSLAGGISLRLWSPRSFPLTFGVFAGPTFSYFASTFSVSGNGVTGGTYTASPISYGAMGGAQAGLQLGNFYLNPYIIYYHDFTDGCKSFLIDGSTPQGGGGPSECSEGSNYIKIPLSFLTYGANFGYKHLLLNVYSHVNKDSSLSSIDLHNYQLSYTFDL